MSITHKFRDFNFGDGFGTSNAILTNIPYEPEVLILGTFNPNTPNSNFADFFYGRNFFWPAFMNLFVNNEVILTNRRIPNRGPLPIRLVPTLEEIKILSSRLKLTFADLIIEVFHNTNSDYQIMQNGNVMFNQIEYNLIQDGKKGNVLGLDNLNSIGQVNWGTEFIIKFLNDNPQIHSIYLTRKPTGVWGEHWYQIISKAVIPNRNFTNIFTPSAQGNPVNMSMPRLINHWLSNTNPNFGKLDNNWLLQNDVIINSFIN